jgi:hypothetical protein
LREYNIKVDLKEEGCGNVDSIRLIHVMVRWLTLSDALTGCYKGRRIVSPAERLSSSLEGLCSMTLVRK